MSFASQEDILDLIEELLITMVEKLTDKRVNKPFPRLSYAESLARYGTDKPDLRFEMPMVDLSDIAASAEFEVFRRAVAEGGQVKAIRGREQEATAENRSTICLQPAQLRRQGWPGPPSTRGHPIILA